MNDLFTEWVISKTRQIRACPSSETPLDWLLANNVYSQTPATAEPALRRKERWWKPWMPKRSHWAPSTTCLSCHEALVAGVGEHLGYLAIPFDDSVIKHGWLGHPRSIHGGLIGTIIYWVDFREHFFLIEVERQAYCIPPCHTSTCADDVIQSPTDLISPYLTNESATVHHKLVAPKHRSQSVSDRSNLQHVFAYGPSTDLAFLRFLCCGGWWGVITACVFVVIELLRWTQFI